MTATDDHAAALAAYRAATDALVEATLALLPELVRAIWPGAAAIGVTCYDLDEGGEALGLTGVFGADGRRLVWEARLRDRAGRDHQEEIDKIDDYLEILPRLQFGFWGVRFRIDLDTLAISDGLA
jgi:hypothetical protein